MWRSACLISLMASIAVFSACGDDGSDGPPPVDTTDTGGDFQGGDTPDADVPDTPPVSTWQAPDETDAWRAMFNYRGRMPDNTGENDLWLMDAGGIEKTSLTDLGGLKFADPPLSCNYGCVVSPDFHWLAVVTGQPTANGRSFELGMFNSSLEIKMLKFGTLADIIDFKFAGSKLYYSKRVPCTGPSCQYDVFVIDLAVGAASTKILTYPTETELEHSTYKGHFKVSPDGSKLVLLNTTIRSVTVNMWQEGKGLVELDYICKFGTKGNCAGTGSEYSDIDPVAIAPDGRYVVFFTFSDRWQRARIYDTENPGVVQLAVLASVPSGSYIEHACDAGVLDPWQWRRVVGDPVFTPDGKEVVFLTESDCPIYDTDVCGDAVPCQPDKARTNLRRVKLESLLAEVTVQSDEVFNVTHNPFGDVTANRRVTGFDMAPDGATLVFTATPTYTQNNKVIDDGGARQRNDREVYRIRLDGTNLQQLSNDLAWLAESPRVMPQDNPDTTF